MSLQIGAQPFFFSRLGLTASNFRALAVQHDDVPGAKFVAIKSLSGIAGVRAKVIEIRRRASRMEFVIADRRPGACFVAPPSRVVAFGKLLRSAFFVCIVT